MPPSTCDLCRASLPGALTLRLFPFLPRRQALPLHSPLPGMYHRFPSLCLLHSLYVAPPADPGLCPLHSPQHAIQDARIGVPLRRASRCVPQHRSLIPCPISRPECLTQVDRVCHPASARPIPTLGVFPPLPSRTAPRLWACTPAHSRDFGRWRST